MAVSEKTLSSKEIMNLLKLSGRDNFIHNYLAPSIANGYVVMLYPDNLKHRNQRYYLTPKGEELLCSLK